MPETIITATPVATACAVFKIDFKGRFVYIDDETEELFGLSREELFGKSLYEFISDESHSVLDAVLRRHNRYESFYEAAPLTIRDAAERLRRVMCVITLNFISGNPVNYQFILNPGHIGADEPDPNREGHSGDITGDSGTKTGSRGVTGILMTAADALDLGIVIVDQTYTVSYKNVCFDRMINAPSEGFPEGNLQQWYERLEMLDAQGRSLPFEQSPCGRLFTQEGPQMGFFRMHGHDQPVMVLAGSIDVADDRYGVCCFIPNEAVTSEVLSPLHLDTNFLLSIAHDIRAPLITIQAFARRLQTGQTGQLDGDGRFAVDCIVENSHILQRMLDGLNELARNRVDYQTPEHFPLEPLIRELIAQMKAFYTGASYRIDVADNLPELFASRHLVMQLFRAILDNAFKFSALAENSCITIEYNRQNDRHEFVISNNGPRVAFEYSEKIFAPFFRTPDAVSIPGTGMGLAIAKDIVTSWGGHIRLDTAKGAGTTISFALPFDMKG